MRLAHPSFHCDDERPERRSHACVRVTFGADTDATVTAGENKDRLRSCWTNLLPASSPA
ncbi:hypothetical protein CBOM_02738 [Ceraceosorus bombacis]|uniref:Uncharacterized protein n=1 Tax=Ceraceosorus bombacis TaxID=401625 RepID=A0A0P1BG81_9BASI|nr:hypothetical protein CBOM_02738 [Ceraceosorus bombacis]